MKQSIQIASIGGIIALAGCAPVIFMGGATTVATSASQERGVKGVFSDTGIKTRIQFEWHNHKPELVEQVDIVVNQGRVLLTGILDKPETQIEAVRLAWKVPGIKEIINETTVGQGQGITDYAKDSWVSTQLKSKILVDDHIRSLNYTVQTVGGIVYLMGIAQDKTELDRVIEIARHIRGVRKVTSYVTLKSEVEKTPPATGTSQAPSSSGEHEGKESQGADFAQPSSEILEEPLAEKQSVQGEPLETPPALLQDEERVATPLQEEAPQNLDSPNTGSSFQ